MTFAIILTFYLPDLINFIYMDRKVMFFNFQKAFEIVKLFEAFATS